MICLLTRDLINPMCNQDRPRVLVCAGQIIHNMVRARVQRRVLRHYMRMYRVRITTKLAVSCYGITMSARVEAATLRILGLFAKESEE